jgi:nucleotide-binding universal stress UspA family protein
MTGGAATSSARVSATDDLAEAPFQRILCGIDGSRSAHEAARQAAILAGSGGALELVAVADEWGVGLNAAAVLTKAHARRALDDIARDLRGCGADVETRVVCGRPPCEALLGEVADHDLIVVARHSRSRFGGIAMGSTASNLAHRAPVPLLIAVPPPHGIDFPNRILVAADGPGRPERAVRMAGLIARSTGSEITLVRLNWSRRSRRPELASAVAELSRLGAEPVEILTGGLPRRKIPELAGRERSALVILGSRGLTGPRALGSISERVAHDAPCSVLIMRPTPADEFSSAASS